MVIGTLSGILFSYFLPQINTGCCCLLCFGAQFIRKRVVFSIAMLLQCLMGRTTVHFTKIMAPSVLYGTTKPTLINAKILIYACYNWDVLGCVSIQLYECLSVFVHPSMYIILYVMHYFTIVFPFSLLISLYILLWCSFFIWLSCFSPLSLSLSPIFISCSLFR